MSMTDRRSAEEDARQRAAAMSERQLQEAIIEAAELHGWMVYHTYDSRRSKAGFLDLMMVRDGVLLALELKTESGRLTPEQQRNGSTRYRRCRA